MTKALNIAYFDKTDDLPGKAIAKLNQDLRRICSFLLEQQNASSVSTKIANSNDKILNQTQQMVSESSKDFTSRLDTATTQMQENYDRTSARIAVLEETTMTFNEAYPIGIIVCNKSKTRAPFSTKTWKFVAEDEDTGVCFWERTA